MRSATVCGSSTGAPRSGLTASPSRSSFGRSCPRTRATPTATSPSTGCGSASRRWEDVRDAPPEEVEEAIRPGGLAHTKAPRIQAALAELGDGIELDWLENAPREEALGFLTALPGVGRKTAACVLIFSFGRPEIPVDTHVERVGKRLGLISPKASFDRAHDELREATPPEDAYELHINLIRHGRAICRPRPRCDQCELRRMCPYWRTARTRVFPANDSPFTDR